MAIVGIMKDSKDHKTISNLDSHNILSKIGY